MIKDLRGLVHKVSNEFALISVENIQKYGEKFTSTTNPANYNIEILSPLFINNNDIVKVQCSSNNPSSGDWIGAYSELFSDVTLSAPMKYGFCDEDSNYLLNGRGVLHFNLTNTRADVYFSLFTNGINNPIQVAQTNITSSVQFINPNQPLRPRVVLSDNPNSLKFLWSSATTTTPQLRWGINPGKYTYIMNATTEMITKSSLCGAPATGIGWFDLGLIHTATFDNLLALYSSRNKAHVPPRIYYIFGDAATNDFSTEFTLHLPTLPGQSPSARPTSLVLMADLGRGSNDNTFSWHEYGRPSINTTSSANHWIQRGVIDGVFHIGDLSYANGYLAAWDYYLNMISPLSSSVVYMSALGNHESDYPGENTYYQGTDSGGECGVITTSVLPLPHTAQKESPWWSYDIGLIHIIASSSEHDFHPNSEQYMWLENDLLSVNRTLTPWIIFGCHRAMYINAGKEGTWDIDTMNLLISTIEPLLWKYHVNIGFYGHTHVVQRMSAVYNKTVVKASTPVYIHDDSLSFTMSRDESSSSGSSDSDGSSSSSKKNRFRTGHTDESTHSNSNPSPNPKLVNTYFYPQATVHHVIGTGGAPFYVNDVSPPPVFDEVIYYKYGYVILQAVNASYLYWEWIESDTNLVIDRAAIWQDSNQKQWDLNGVDDSTVSTDPNTHDKNIISVANSVVVALLLLSIILIAVFQYYRYKTSINKSNPTNTHDISSIDYEGDDIVAGGTSHSVLLTTRAYTRVPRTETVHPKVVPAEHASVHVSSSDDDEEIVVDL